MSELITIQQAASILGMTTKTVRRLFSEGELPGVRTAGKLIFREDEVVRIKARLYPDGLSHRQIAERYGIKRTSVIYHFKRLKVKPSGVNRGGNGQTVYSSATVQRFAKILGWQDQLQNPSSEA